MIEITLNDSNLVVTINDKKGLRKANFNDMLKNINMNIYFALGTFKAYYDELKKSRLLKTEQICKILLTSKLFPSHRIPSNYQLLKTDIDLSNGTDKIEKIALRLFNTPINTIYECKNNEDIISACLYHYITKGYILKYCANCENWFLGKGKKECCSTKCKNEYDKKYKTHKVNLEKQRIQQPIPRKLKQIRQMLEKRNTSDKEIFESELRIFKENNPTDEKLLNWLNNKHNELKIKKG